MVSVRVCHTTASLLPTRPVNIAFHVPKYVLRCVASYKYKALTATPSTQSNEHAGATNENRTQRRTNSKTKQTPANIMNKYF